MDAECLSPSQLKVTTAAFTTAYKSTLDTGILSNLEVYTNNNTQQGKVKLGRAGNQHIDFHGGPSGNFMTSVSSSGSPKPLHVRVNSGATNTDFRIDVDGNLDVPADVTLGSSNVILRKPTGGYGSLEVDGGAVGGWEGYSIGGRVVLMHDNATACGLFDDVNNKWMIYSVLNGALDLRHAGNVKLTTTSTGVDVTGTINADAATVVGAVTCNAVQSNAGAVTANRPSAVGTEHLFKGTSNVGGTGATNFRIDCDGDVRNTNNSYGALSDARLKEDVVEAASQWEDVKALSLKNYNLITAEVAEDKALAVADQQGLKGPRHLGVIAQDLEQISPGLVEIGEDGYRSVNYSLLYLKAVGALQEALGRIEDLEQRVTALEA